MASKSRYVHLIKSYRTLYFTHAAENRLLSLKNYIDGVDTILHLARYDNKLKFRDFLTVQQYAYKARKAILRFHYKYEQRYTISVISKGICLKKEYHVCFNKKKFYLSFWEPPTKLNKEELSRAMDFVNDHIKKSNINLPLLNKVVMKKVKN